MCNPMMRLTAPVILFAALITTGPTALARDASWVRGEVKLNLRRGPGTEFKIIGSVSSEQSVEVLETEDGWNNVRLTDGREGWIPGGYLSGTPPAAVLAERLETEVTALRDRLETAEKQASNLSGENESLRAADAEQRRRLDVLAVENRELRALQRWREWVTGASLLAVGMIIGAILRRSGSARKSTRLRV